MMGDGNGTSKPGGITLRWLLLLVWPCGYALTCRFFNVFGFQHSAVILLATVGAATLLLVLEPSILQSYFAPTIIGVDDYRREHLVAMV